AGSPPQSGQESLPGAGVLEDVADFSCRFAAASTQGDPAMTWRRILCPRLARTVLLPLGLTVFLAFSAAVGQPRKIDVLRIGSSGSLASEAPGGKEEAALKTLKTFIKDETGLDNEIIRQKDWRELADKLAKRQLHLGVFQGFEFAWAQEQYPALKPLAIAVNVYRYPVVYVVTSRNNAARDFAGLEGQSLALPATGQGYLRLFVERQAEALGKKPSSFFSSMQTRENVEDALDDVVDGTV